MRDPTGPQYGLHLLLGAQEHGDDVRGTQGQRREPDQAVRSVSLVALPVPVLTVAYDDSPLEMHDIAQIKSLLPELVSFAYIDSEVLRVHASAAPADADPRTAKREQRMRELDEAYRSAGAGEEGQDDGRKKSGETVLLFSFNDGELKSPSGAGKIINKKFS